MIDFLKKIISKTSGIVFGALGLSALFQNIGTALLIIVVIFIILYAIKVFKK